MTDEDIEKIAHKYMRRIGSHWESEWAMPDNSICDFARELLEARAEKVEIENATMLRVLRKYHSAAHDMIVSRGKEWQEAEMAGEG